MDKINNNQITIDGENNIIVGDICCKISKNYICGNRINIGGKGNKIIGNVYGSDEENNYPLSSDDSILISGTPDLSETKLYGARQYRNGNRLCIDGWYGVVNGLHCFSKYEFLNIPRELVNSEAVITVKGSFGYNGIFREGSIYNLTSANLWTITFDSNVLLQKGDIVVLIDYSVAEDVEQTEAFKVKVFAQIGKQQELEGEVINDTIAKIVSFRVL